MTAGPRGPTAGLTVERLAALLREYGALVIQGRAHDADQQAAWLLPRLGAVSLGAPAAARIAPTDAMIDAAFRSMHGYLNEPGARGLTENRQRAHVEAMLRAALAAAGEP